MNTLLQTTRRFSPTQAEAETTAPPPSPAAAPLKKLSFGGIKARKDTKTSYPVFNPQPGANAEIELIAARILQRSSQFEALKGALETDKAELKMLVTPFYFETNHGRAEVPSSIAVQTYTDKGVPADEVLVTFQNRYAKLESEASLIPVLGEQTGLYFRQTFEFKIDGDKIPQDKAQELIDELQQVLAKYHALDALEVKDAITPVPDFHTKRHTLLTPEQNLALEQACPITAMVKTKGRK